MGAIVSCVSAIASAIGSVIMAIVSGVGAVLQAIIGGIVAVFGAIVSCLTCGRGGSRRKSGGLGHKRHHHSTARPIV